MGKSSAGNNKKAPKTLPRVFRNRKIGVESKESSSESDDTTGGSNVPRKVNFRLMQPQVDLDEGKHIAFPVVQNYVFNVWKKFGIEKTMMNSKGFYFFKFSTHQGMLNALENGPWMIRATPIILNKWDTNVSLTKEDLTRVPVWVKMYDIPLSGFMEDGLSIIASKLGIPMMLNSYTSTMCMESWGRPNYARAMIEISPESELKEVLNVETPSIDGKKKITGVITIEYEWKPPRCLCCKVFGNNDAQCPKNIPVVPVTKQTIAEDGFHLVTKKKGQGATKDVATGGNKQQTKGFGVGNQKQRFVYRPKQTKTYHTD
ncbi:uncharacterized protein [Rutidosis leptorrhynchoides]|uniref:uncharacterized protein n=1 Tax=Rutidosis leptorrhynchoides TaxID=125765 RepID=UPI003A994847